MVRRESAFSSRTDIAGSAARSRLYCLAVGRSSACDPARSPSPSSWAWGAAAELGGKEHHQRRAVAAQVKERFLRELGEVEFILNGDVNGTMSHVANVCFPGVDSEAFMLALRSELAISNGSACTSASYSPSHVLKAMGLSDELVLLGGPHFLGSGNHENPNRANRQRRKWVPGFGSTSQTPE